MFRRILIPVDGSALAETALPCAGELAQLTGAGVTLTRVVGPIDERGERPEGAAEANARAYLAVVARPFERAGVAVRAEVVAGDPADRIIRAAGAADLVVLTSHGRSGVGRWALGSVADRVLRGAPAPVLLVRADQTELVATGHPRRILVALDGSSLAEAALLPAVDLARRSGAALVLTRAVARPRDIAASVADLDPVGRAGRIARDQEGACAYLAALGRRLTDQGLSVAIRLRSGPAVEAILACAGEERADLIAIGAHGRGGHGRWALGSVADRVLRSAAAPVLLVRAATPADAARRG